MGLVGFDHPNYRATKSMSQSDYLAKAIHCHSCMRRDKTEYAPCCGSATDVKRSPNSPLLCSVVELHRNDLIMAAKTDELYK